MKLLTSLRRMVSASISMVRMKGRYIIGSIGSIGSISTFAGLLAIAPSSVLAIQPYNLPKGATELSREFFDLHMFAFWICVVISIVVFGVMLWSIIFHRKDAGYKAAKFSHSTTLEIVWTVIPIIILVVLLVPGTASLIKAYDSSEAEIDIKITGYQWRWQYEYLNENVEFFSNLKTSEEQINDQEAKGENYLLEVDEEIVVPVKTKVRFLVTAADVLHSWWVPELGVKKDAIPGFINEAWTKVEEEGVYRGQCAELCGTRHAFMPIVVRAVDRTTYDSWLAERKKGAEAEAALAQRTDWTKEELIERGQQVYAINCAACHQNNGKGLPPAFPALDGSPLALGALKDQIDIILNGRSGTTMQAFGGLLSDADVAAVITYTRNAWSNKGRSQPDAAFPKDVAAQRKQSK